MIRPIPYQTFLPALLLGCAVCVSQASTDMFLKFADVKGESTDRDHVGQIDVLSWSWGVINSGSTHTGGGAAAGKASFQDLRLTKFTDSSTTDLLAAAASGKVYPRATLYLRKPGSPPLQFYRVICEDVRVSNVRMSGATYENHLTEAVTLNFARVGIEYVMIDSKGQPAPSQFAYNIREQVPGGIDFKDEGVTPPKPDTDGDGLPDAWEQQYGTNPNIKDAGADLDGDGATNYEEYLAGTDPSKRDSVFVATLRFAAGARSATLSWKSAAGMDYNVYLADNPEGAYNLYRTVPSAGDGSTSLLVPLDFARKFFRVQAVPSQ